MNIKRRSLLAFLAVAPTLLKQAIAETAATLDERNPVAAYGHAVVYSVYRKNQKIGEHTLQFTNNDHKLLVDIESRIVVTVLKLPVFRFNYRSTETWIDGQLQSVDAATNNNGKKHQVSAKRISNNMPHLLLKDKKGNTTTAKIAYTSNHWNSHALTADKMFNTLTGKANDIVLETIGVETISLGNDTKNTITATRYRLAGKLKTDVWYDNAGRWVQLRFKGEDGNAIEYRCKGFNV